MKACNKTIGRRYGETGNYNPFLEDFYRIKNSKAYMRLNDKTDVIFMPDNPHIRRRNHHTNEVIAASVKIADRLGLNIFLCMAIAAGHDIGHTPLGHAGERVLTKFGGKPFKHEINSVLIAQHVEMLDLTYETLDGMLRHSRGRKDPDVETGKPQEYSVVMLTDKMYIYSDIEDAIKCGYLDAKKLPECALELGSSREERADNTIEALIAESERKGFVDLSEGKTAENFRKLKRYMDKNVYEKIDEAEPERMLYDVCGYFSSGPWRKEFDVDPVITASLLTDRELYSLARLLEDTEYPSIEKIKHFGIFEILPGIEGRNPDYTNPDLDWADERRKDYIILPNSSSHENCI